MEGDLVLCKGVNDQMDTSVFAIVHLAVQKKYNFHITQHQSIWDPIYKLTALKGDFKQLFLPEETFATILSFCQAKLLSKTNQENKQP